MLANTITTEELCLRLKEEDEKNLVPFENYNRTRNWLSDLGHPCARYVYYTRTCGDQRETVPPRGMKRFWVGREMEDPIRKRVREAAKKIGMEIRQVGWKFYIDEIDASGKVDDIIVMETVTGRMIDAFANETKTTQDYMLDKIKTIDDMLAQDAHWWQQYPFQCMGYQVGAAQAGMMEERKGLFTLVGIPSGDVKFIPCDFRQDVWDHGVKNFETVKVAMEREEVPDRIRYGKPCAFCPFKTLCLPEKENASGVGLVGDPAIVEDLHTLLGLREQGAEYKRLDAKLKKTFKECADGLFVSKDGKVAVEVKRKSRTSYDVPPEIREKYKHDSEAVYIEFSDLEDGE